MNAGDNPRLTQGRKRLRSSFARSVPSIGCALLLLCTAGCATSHKTALVPSVRNVCGNPRALAASHCEAQSGNADAEVAMGLRESLLHRYKQANIWYRKAAALDNAAGEFDMGLDYAMGRGLKQNDVQANSWYRKAAKQGYLSAQINLATDYYVGRGIEQSYAYANFWYRRAAEQGNASAETALGYDYYSGRGVPRSYARANSWYRKAAERGLATAQYALGYDYGRGQGIATNFVMANYWFRQAARQGSASAEFALGMDYTVGLGIAKNEEKGFFWLHRAAEQALPRAELYLGADYYKGRGTARNRAKAMRWLRKGSAQGNALPTDAWCRLKGKAGGYARKYHEAIEASARDRPAGMAPPGAKAGFPSTCGFYPDVSQVLGEQGTVMVSICIGKEGQLVRKPTVARSSGSARLDAAAVRYAFATSGHWSAARRNGVPVSFCAKLPVRFRITVPARSAVARGRPRPLAPQVPNS